ncbi:MAG TPA: hypothetical protein VMM12_00635 [Longimicrobiales bacterium]|nr:hypothetical protein [Longimicrobiales bacterium]
MRRYTDRDGRPWDVVIGRESFGALLALFVPAAGNAGAPRQAMLAAESHVDADAELDGMEPAALDALFERSEPKEPG